MGADGRVPFVGLAAVKAQTQSRRGRGFSGRRLDSLLFLSGNQVKREENDQNEEYPGGPEEAAPNGGSALLGVVKNPESDGQTDNICENEKNHE